MHLIRPFCKTVQQEYMKELLILQEFDLLMEESSVFSWTVDAFTQLG